MGRHSLLLLHVANSTSLSSHRYTISTSLAFPSLFFPSFFFLPFSFLPFSFLPFALFLISHPFFLFYYICSPLLSFSFPPYVFALRLPLYPTPFLFFSFISSLMFSLLLTHILYYHHHLRFISHSFPSIFPDPLSSSWLTLTDSNFSPGERGPRL